MLLHPRQSNLYLNHLQYKPINFTQPLWLTLLSMYFKFLRWRWHGRVVTGLLKDFQVIVPRFKIFVRSLGTYCLFNGNCKSLINEWHFIKISFCNSFCMIMSVNHKVTPSISFRGYIVKFGGVTKWYQSCRHTKWL